METYHNTTDIPISPYILAHSELESIKASIIKYLYAFLLLVGTFGNIVCSIFLRKYYRTSWSVCFYLILSMFFGLIELYIYCGNNWFEKVTNSNLTLKINVLSNAVCKVYNFVTNVLLFFNSWIMVAISIETMITVVYPKKMYKMCSVDKARSVVLLITVLVICFNLHYFWTIGLSQPENDPDVVEAICHHNYQPQMADQVFLIVSLFNFLLENLLPFAIVTIFVSISTISIQLHKKDLSFELKKYIVDIKTLEQLQKPMLIVLAAFALLKACHSSEQLLRFIVVYFGVNVNFLTISYFAFANMTLTYIFISLKPIVFIVLCHNLRQDIIKGVKRCINKVICRRSRYKSYIAPETTNTTDDIKQYGKKQNGDILGNVKCTNV